MATELIIATFSDDEDAAEKVYERVQELKQQDALTVLDAAIIVKPKEGEVSWKDVKDVDKKQGTVFGAITGGIIGLLGGPVGVVLGAAAGAATGRVTANLADYGVSDDLIKGIESSMPDGSSAIILYLEMQWANKAVNRLEELGATVHHETLSEGTRWPPNTAATQQ
jgi:uncharacterized membrane protein